MKFEPLNFEDYMDEIEGDEETNLSEEDKLCMLDEDDVINMKNKKRQRFI